MEIKDYENSYDIKVESNNEMYCGNGKVFSLRKRTCSSCGYKILYKVRDIVMEMTKERWIGNDPKESD